MDKKQFAEHVITSVRNLSIVTTISRRVRLQQKGMHHYGLCPFHNDKKLGSFVVTESKFIWKCFAGCGGGDVVKFFSMLDNINYLESAFKLALEHDIITDSEYRKYYEKSRFTQEQVQKIEKKYENIDKERLKNDIADEDILDDVFRTFIKCIGEYYKENNKDDIYDGLLTKEHKQHLLETRELTEEEIEEGCFFSFPSRRVMKRFSKAISEKYGNEEILSKIPGFYKELGSKYYTFVTHKGIGIGIKNYDNKILGLQIRRDEKKDLVNGDKESRYLWFSSSFAMFDDKYECGTSSGSPIDVVYPPVLKSSTIFITEGRFKAYKVAKTVGSIVLSVQGVSTWRGVLAELQRIPNSSIIQKLYPNKKFEPYCILVAFDADMQYNPAVFSQARKMADYLQQNGYIAYYLNWDDELGKGVDDVIINQHKDAIKRFEKEYWDKNYDIMIKTILNDIKAENCDELIKNILLEDKNKPGNEKKTYKEIKDIPPEIIKIYFKRMMNLTPLGKNEISQEHRKMLSKKNVC